MTNDEFVEKLQSLLNEYLSAGTPLDFISRVSDAENALLTMLASFISTNVLFFKSNKEKVLKGTIANLERKVNLAEKISDPN